MGAFCAPSLFAQTMARSPSPVPVLNSPDLLPVLAKKIDEQNAKIDMLSQQILKLQQEVANCAGSKGSPDSRPGVMIGEATPSAPASTPVPHSTPSPTAASGNSHIVSRGETLTSIAKMYKVSVDELQKFNHIENPLKLQVGQTIIIPGSPTPAASPSAGE